MKKFISITFIIMIFPVLIGCSKVSQTKDMQIQSLETTKEESDVLNLLCSNLDYKIYEYKINDKIKTVTIKYYKLNSEGKWDNLNNLIDNNPSSGKLSISKSRVNEQMEFSIQKEDGVTETTAPEITSNKKFTSTSITWNESSNIELEKEIPLMVEVRTNSDTIERIDINNFNEPEKVKNYENVFAITVTFSEKENS
ncbi:MAG: hypothetical protein KIB43_04400 [Clostridium baratii]|uniref:hypothetical protein n=1 Tax=Clostridium baratii TaxID=1561 RepID=UPI00242B8514|nr:hypothetical protein [Clostridium baratii]MBS6006178.1 hypothetical protein [Clostridium baratii]MDU1053251.1 hypothetical protein [Clostridium baratii]MDU4911223.1 hypothetical protein [Clostridium baratii]